MHMPIHKKKPITTGNLYKKLSLPTKQHNTGTGNDSTICPDIKMIYLLVAFSINSDITTPRYDTGCKIVVLSNCINTYAGVTCNFGSIMIDS